jgi:hypothetical protein
MQAPYATFMFTDHFGRIKRKTIQYDSQATLVDYQAVTTALSAALDAVTDLELTKVELTLPQTGTFDEDSESNRDVGATFSGVLYNKDGAKASLKIPGIKLSLVQADGTIDVEGATVAALLAFFVETTPYDCLLSDGETIDHWVSGSLDS